MALLGFAFFRSDNVFAHTEHITKCLCHNYLHHPIEVCSDNDSYKVGHQSHLNSGFDILGRCPVEPSPTPVPPTPTPEPKFHSQCREFSCVQVEGEGESICETDKDCEPQITPTPTPTETPRQPDPGSCNGCGNQPSAFMCPDGKVLEGPKALFVHRAGESATVTWFRTSGNEATIVDRVTGHTVWEFSVRDLQSFDWNSFTIHALNPNLGYDFGVYQHNNCGDGTVAVAVVVDGPKPVTYPFSFWEVWK